MSSATKNKLGRQLLWFIGLYLISIIAVGAFSFGARWLLGIN